MKVLRILEKMEDDGGMRVDILINFGPVYMNMGGPEVGKVNRLGGVTHLSIIKSLILIWSRLHDKWADHMRD